MVEEVPAIAVGDQVELPAPVVAADGDHVLLAADEDTGHILSFDADGSVREHTYRAPGSPVSVAQTASGTTWVVHEATDGTTTMQTVRVP